MWYVFVPVVITDSFYQSSSSFYTSLTPWRSLCLSFSCVASLPVHDCQASPVLFRFMGKSTPYDIAVLDTTLPGDVALARVAVTKLDAVQLHSEPSVHVCLLDRMDITAQR